MFTPSNSPVAAEAEAQIARTVSFANSSKTTSSRSRNQSILATQREWIDSVINVWNLRFKDPAVQFEYLDYQQTFMINRILLLLGIVLCVPLSLTFFGTVSQARFVVSAFLTFVIFVVGAVLFIRSKYFLQACSPTFVSRISKSSAFICLVVLTIILNIELWFNDTLVQCGVWENTMFAFLNCLPLAVILSLEQGLTFNSLFTFTTCCASVFTALLSSKFTGSDACTVEYQHSVVSCICNLIIGHVYEKSLRIQFLNLKRAQVLRTEAENYSNEAINAKSMFFSYIIHEIRIPLNAISLALELLSENVSSHTLTEEVARDMLKVMKNQIEGTSKILNDALSLQKIEKGMFKINPEPCNINHFLNMMSWTYSKILEELKINFVYKCDNLPKGILMDKHRLQQVIGNLLSNASKFTKPSGNIELIVTLEDAPLEMKCFREEDENEDEEQFDSSTSIPDMLKMKFSKILRIAVKDDGLGISEADQAKLFKPFVQVAAGKGQKGKGTGLGLCIANHIVELHGGRTGVISKLGAGSTFYFYIPVIEVEVKGEEMETSKLAEVHLDHHQESTSMFEERRVSTASEILISSSASGVASKDDKAATSCSTSMEKELKECKEISKDPASVKVLLVEDSLTNRKLMERMIRSWGYQCLSCENGNEALAMIGKPEESGFDLVITDQEMPIMDGMQLIKTLRESGNRVPVIVLSGNPMEDQRTALLESGADLFLTKPTNSEKMKSSIQSLLKQYV